MKKGTTIVDKEKWKIVVFDDGAIVDVKDISLSIKELSELSTDLKLVATDWYCQMDSKFKELTCGGDI